MKKLSHILIVGLVLFIGIGTSTRIQVSVLSALEMSPRCLVVEPHQMVRGVEKLRFDLGQVLTFRRRAPAPIQEYGMLLQAVTGVRKEQIHSGIT